MVQVDYSNEESLKHALAGVHVVISTVSVGALDVQLKVAAAGKEAGVQLLVPSDFGGMLSDATKGLYATKVNTHKQLKALGMPYAAFYTGMFVDMAWIPCVASLYLALRWLYAWLITTSKVHQPRCHERESVRWRRREHQDYDHHQTRCRPICYLRLDAPFPRPIEEPHFRHRWRHQGKSLTL